MYFRTGNCPLIQELFESLGFCFFFVVFEPIVSVSFQLPFNVHELYLFIPQAFWCYIFILFVSIPQHSVFSDTWTEAGIFLSLF